MSMRNVLDIDGYSAVVSYDPETNLLRGEFIGLNGGADFYADNVAALLEEGRNSLSLFLEVCRERGIAPRKNFSGKFQMRLDPSVHEKATVAAAARGTSLNALIEEAVQHELEAVA